MSTSSEPANPLGAPTGSASGEKKDPINGSNTLGQTLGRRSMTGVVTASVTIRHR